MRTSLSLDADVLAAAEQLRRQRNLSLSEAVNELARAGIRGRAERTPYQQRTRPMGLRIEVSNVADALDRLAVMDERPRSAPARPRRRSPWM